MSSGTRADIRIMAYALVLIFGAELCAHALGVSWRVLTPLFYIACNSVLVWRLVVLTMEIREDMRRKDM